MSNHDSIRIALERSDAQGWSCVNLPIGDLRNLLSKFDAMEAVLVLRECPDCGVQWSPEECTQMLSDQEASCTCGYSHSFTYQPLHNPPKDQS